VLNPVITAGLSHNGRHSRMLASPPERRSDDDGPVPVFGSWRAIYAALALTAVLVMALLALFSRWPY
jgi:anti-sigma-K factor RskA